MVHFPEILGYKILTELGKGGVATVYLGIQERLNRKVAIKILDPILLTDEVAARRFEKEAKIAANLSHSHIVQIYDSGKAGDYHYIVMEYLEESLKERMMRSPKGRMHPEIALDIVEEMMKTLDYAHFRGIYHRDIKPENIMFRQDGTPVLVDFGIAHVYDSTDKLTKSNMLIGTVDYMSPEQCKAEKVDGRSDIYSLGVVLFEMLCGRVPYWGETPLSVALQHIDKPVPRLPREWSRFQPLIDKMMAKETNERISSGPEFIQVLDKMLTGVEDSPGQPEESLPEPADEAPYSGAAESPPTRSRRVSTTLILGKPFRARNLSFDRYLGYLKEKLKPFSNYIKEKLAPLARKNLK